MIDDLGGLFSAADVDGNGSLDKEELLSLFSRDSIVDTYPQAAVFASKIDEDFDEFDADGSGEIDPQEFRQLLLDVDTTMRNLPPTAQVASQQGMIPLVGEDIILTGRLAEVVWKFLYLDMQISNRNKLQVGFDWTKQIFFGRDTSRF